MFLIPNSRVSYFQVPGYPKSIKVVAIDAAEAGIPIFTTHDKIKIHSIQGELFWQLGGTAGIKNLRGGNHHESCPDERLLSQMLGTGPLLILSTNLSLIWPHCLQQDREISSILLEN